MGGRTSRRSKDPWGTPVHGPDVIRALAAAEKIQPDPDREGKAVLELQDELKRVLGVDVPRKAVLDEMQRVLATLTLDQFAGVYTDPVFGKSDEYGTYVAGVGVYIKVRVPPDIAEVLVISFHPIREEPLRTRGGDIVRRRP